MKTKDVGGYAFPQPPSYDPTTGLHMLHEGMSLRDWFAGQALRAQWVDGTAMTPEEAADLAYQVADAFITARKGGDDA